MVRRRKSNKSIRKMRGIALIEDIVMIAVGIVIALFLARIGLIDVIVDSVHGYSAIASFFAGIFFTSVFTLAPASVALSRIAEHAPSYTVAFWGALGALCGDLILFFFVRDRFYDDLVNTIKPSIRRRISRSFHFGFLKWISPVIGAFIIASPLPDEFAIALLGASKVRLLVLIPVSFVMNVLGIYLLLGFVHIFF